MTALVTTSEHKQGLHWAWGLGPLLHEDGEEESPWQGRREVSTRLSSRGAPGKGITETSFPGGHGAFRLGSVCLDDQLGLIRHKVRHGARNAGPPIPQEFFLL